MIPLSDDTGIRLRRYPIVTLMLIAANTLVFLYELTLGPGLDDFFYSAGVIPCLINGGCYGVDTVGGSPFWTLLSSMFVHASAVHIAGNMLFLWIFGDNIEDNFGHLGFLAFYLVSGLAAGITHVVFNASSEVPSIGASGAIAGVLAAYLILYPRSRVRTLIILGFIPLLPRIPAFVLIGIWFWLQLYSGFLSFGVQTAQTTDVAIWAHIGGFFAGLVMVLVVKALRAEERPTY